MKKLFIGYGDDDLLRKIKEWIDANTSDYQQHEIIIEILEN